MPAPPKRTVEEAVARYGSAVRAKISNAAAAGEPEDQLRAPFEALVRDLAALIGPGRTDVTLVGEAAVRDLRSRPDYAVTVRGALVGHVELKAPGKGADPRRFTDAHDRAQWERLRSLPNLLYSDGNALMLWRDGEPVGAEVRFAGDLATAGSKLAAPAGLLSLVERFLCWEPLPPRSAKDLALVTARLCRLLRNEVTEQLEHRNEALTALATDWRRLLFPDATDERFADGYAQAVTFGMLMARARRIPLRTGLDGVARELGTTNSLIGAALRLLTESAESRGALDTSLGALTRVLDAVDWQAISGGDPETWLYFYENFLAAYDNALRKQTGSYYTPPEVVTAMVEMVDEALRGPGFALHAGMASPSVTVADPATGTGTFLLGVFRRIAATVRDDEGGGAVPAAVNAALRRVVAFEMQLGPFAVAQLRIYAEILELTGAAPRTAPRMFVADTLGDPREEHEWIPAAYGPIAQSRREANKVKREEPVTVVIGNPPYKEKAKGLGGWVEDAGPGSGHAALLAAWMPPRDWGAGAHSKHLRNLYVYFWRWATWKVFDHHPTSNAGIVSFITVAGFLGGPGFQRMREYLRRTCDAIWVIDCSPEGHQPEVRTRVFEGVQQPVCIVLAARSPAKREGAPAVVRFRALPAGPREEKFAALARISLRGKGWTECPSEGRAPFLPASTGPWATFPALESLFLYNGSGVQAKRTWVMAPDAESLLRRWRALLDAPAARKEELFHPTLRDGLPADRHIRSIVAEPLPGFEPQRTPLANERGACVPPVPYGFRSFNRQWIIPDPRLLTQPNAALWASRSERQIYLTALARTSPTGGPAVTLTGLVPDLDHYKGSFGGRVFPLWQDADGREPNVRPALLDAMGSTYGLPVTPDDLMAYLAAVLAHPAFVARFRDDLSTPGLRVPVTAAREVFARAVALGRRVLWLHTFGERMADPKDGRPAAPPRLPADRRPRIPSAGRIPEEPASMPDALSYDPERRRLLVGAGFVENVPPAVWEYEVSGKRVLVQWFSYRKANRDRPLIGDRRPPSALGDIQPDHWLPEYTTELLNLLNVLGGLVELEPAQAALLDEICAGPLVTAAELEKAGAFSDDSSKRRRRSRGPAGPGLFDDA